MIQIGNFGLRLPSVVRLRKAPTTQLPVGEKGSPGRYVTSYGRSGPILNLAELDYAAAMQLPTRLTTVEKMLSDDAVGASYMALTLPILAAQQMIEPGTRDSLGREMADFCQADFEGMSTSQHQHRAEVLDCLPYGFTVLEKDFEIREDGLVHMRNLVFRPHGSIIEWQASQQGGGPRGVVQLDSDGKEVELEIERLLIFTHGRRGANVTGRSIFRSAHKAWFYKDGMDRIAAIAAERGAVGIPVGTMLQGDDDELQTHIETILKGVRAFEEGYVVETPRWKFRVEGLTGDRVDVIPILDTFRRAVFVSVLADFLALGSTDAGSWALSRDKSSFFVMSLRSVLNMIEDTYNRHLLAPWARANWGDVPAKSLPRMVHGPLNTRNVAEWFAAVTGAVKEGVLPTEDRLAAMAREILEIPDLPERADVQTEDQRAAQQPNQPGDKPAALPGVRVQQAAKLQEPRLESLVKIEALGINVRLAEIEQTLDRGEGRMVEKVGRLQAKQARRLAARGEAIRRRGDWDQLSTEEVPTEEEAEAIQAELVDLYGFGKEEYARELDSQGAKAPKVEEDGPSVALLAAFAIFAGRRLADRMLNAWGMAVMAGDSPILPALQGMSGQLLEDLARQGASLALGTGRSAAAAAASALVEVEIYSTALDGKVCSICRAHEGREYKVGEGPSVPNSSCEGGPRCRCVRVPKVGKEAPRS